MDTLARPSPEMLVRRKAEKIKRISGGGAAICVQISVCAHLGVDSCKTLNVSHSVFLLLLLLLLLLLVYVQHSLPTVVHIIVRVTPDSPRGLLGFAWRLLGGSLFMYPTSTILQPPAR